jgi:hypothetical protein
MSESEAFGQAFVPARTTVMMQRSRFIHSAWVPCPCRAHEVVRVVSRQVV